MSTRDRIQTVAARAHYRMSKRFGEAMTFSNRGETPVAVYGIPGLENTVLNFNAVTNTDEEDTVKPFSIPIQTGFPPVDGVVSVTAVIVWGGVQWSVTKPATGSLKAVYKLETVKQKTRRIG